MSTLNKVELSTGGVSTVYKIGNVVEGYLDKANNKFYEDAQYTTEINAESDVVYLSLDTNKQYRYDTTNLVFVSISGGNDDHVYDTKADMLADLANVGDGDIMYTKEETPDSLAERVSALETDKQDKTDNSLATTAKTVVGAINEVNTNLGSKLANSAAGSATQPIYINSNGLAVPTSYSVEKSVPSDAKFTDTTYSVVTTSANGLMSSSDKTKLNGIAAGAQVNSITGIKGNAESSYRTGNVNLTPANIGAVAKSGDTMTGNLAISGADKHLQFEQSSTSNDYLSVHVWGTSTLDRYIGIYDPYRSNHPLYYNRNVNAVTSNATFNALGINNNAGWQDMYYNNEKRCSFYCNTGDKSTELYAITSTLNLRSSAHVNVKCESALNVCNASGSAGKPIYAGSYNTYSSRLVKENIIDMTENDGLKVLKLRPVHYDLKKNFGGTKNHCGLIAEELLEVFPEAVTVPKDYDEKNFDEEKGALGNDILGIDYAKLTPHLIKLCQIQQKEIDDLKERVNELEKKIG